MHPLQLGRYAAVCKDFAEMINDLRKEKPIYLLPLTWNVENLAFNREFECASNVYTTSFLSRDVCAYNDGAAVLSVNYVLFTRYR